MNILVYANCQGAVVENFLIPEISKHHSVSLKNRINYSSLGDVLRGSDDVLPDDFIEDIAKSDIFIYQPLSSKHGIFSTDESVKNSVKNYLKKNSIKISFPYMYNNALWPVYVEGNTLKADGALLSAARSADSEIDFLNMYSSGIMRFDYFDRFESTVSILEEKEKYCDVKVSKFIKSNLSKRRLFLTQNHPASSLFVEVAGQMLSIVNKNISIPFDFGEYKKANENSKPNLCKLPGYYPIDSYSFKHYNFKFINGPDVIADEFYRKYLTALYNIFRGRQATIPPAPEFV